MASHELERDLTAANVGYLSKEDYQKRREQLEREKALKALKRMSDGSGAEAPARKAEGGAEEEVRKKKKKEKRKPAGALSFDDDLDAEPDASPSLRPKKMGKCQDANVSFLELNEREKVEAAERQEAAMRGILAEQQRMRAEDVTLRYTFRSELTQRELPKGIVQGTITVKRGWAAEEVAAAVRGEVEKLGGKFAPNSVQGLKEERDGILVCCCAGAPSGSFLIPGSVSLVELSTRRWADSGSSLFDEFAHGIVVTERRWYESQRHTYPYSTWRKYETRDEYMLREYVATRGQAVDPLIPNRNLGKR